MPKCGTSVNCGVREVSACGIVDVQALAASKFGTVLSCGVHGFPELELSSTVGVAGFAG